MRLLYLAPLLSLCASIVSQAPPSQATITYEIDVAPPGDDNPIAGQWMDLTGQVPLSIGVKDFRMRITGTEGGWGYPVLGVETANAYVDAPRWLTQDGSYVGAHQVNWWECQFPVGDPAYDVWRKPTFQFWVDAALNAGQSVNDVALWCQPFLTQQTVGPVLNPSTRLWRADPPLWPAAHQALWMGILEDLATGVPNPRMTAFSGGAALRQALLMQSYMVDGHIGTAVDYLNSSEFKVAVAEGWLFLTVQPFALRSALLQPGTAWLDDEEVPRLMTLAPPPRVGNGKNARVAVFWPQHSGSTVANWGGVAPGTFVTFLSNWATPPVTLTFPTTTGPTSAVARAQPSMAFPGLHSCRVPVNAIPGPILYQAGLDAWAVVIGYVTPQLGPP